MMREYKTLEDIKAILDKSSKWKLSEMPDLSPNIEDFLEEVKEDSIVFCYKDTCFKNLNVYLFIHKDLTFSMLACFCEVECCGEKYFQHEKFSMGKIYKFLKRLIYSRSKT